MATYSSSTTRYETNNGYWITLPAFQKLKRFFWQPGPSISNSLFILFLSYFLSVISVCYISIYVKVRRSRHPQHHVADGLKERRLTSTLFLFILGFLLTFLPKVACLGVSNFPELIFRLSFPSFYDIGLVIVIFVTINSLMNPIVYVIPSDARI